MIFSDFILYYLSSQPIFYYIGNDKLYYYLLLANIFFDLFDELIQNCFTKKIYKKPFY